MQNELQLVLDTKSLNELNSFIQDLPLKHGLPLMNYLNQKIAEQNQPKTEAPKTEVPKKTK